MTTFLQELWNFVKHPTYSEDPNSDTAYRFNILFKLLVIALVLSFLLGGLIGGIQTVFKLDLGEHAIEKALESFPLWFLAFAAVVLAPLIEELLFRGPMVFFKNKSYFKFIFYILTLIFGFYHITNFELSTTTLLLSPILVAPQISIGILLGYIRVRFNLWWAILLHALYNAFLLGPVIIIKLFDLSVG